MWAAVSICILAICGVWGLCSLTARMAKQKELLKQQQKEIVECEKMEKLMERVSVMSVDELDRRLFTPSDKE